MTSHDVVDAVRRRLNMRRVGHAGTLDPLATGVLVILLGQSTKFFDKFSGFDKAYEATLTLGLTTDTSDIQGKILKNSPYGHVSRKQVEETFQKFVGEIEQIPPMVSAIKVKGKRLYQLARSGLVVEREPRPVKIYSLGLLEFIPPFVKFFVECSKGMYVRKLGEDVGELLGCGACISQIHRTKVGPFLIENSVALESFDESHIRSWPA